MQSQQTPVVVVEKSANSTPPFSSIEIIEPIAKKLKQICAEQNITVKELVSALLQRMLLDHKKETKQILEKFRCRDLVF